MLAELAQKTNLFHLLYQIDLELASQHRTSGCRYCGGSLHLASYQRKPRGGPEGLPDEYLTHLSMCCGHDDCRRRNAPPSCRFMGRYVYWSAIILAISALRQNRSNSSSLSQLTNLFGVSWQTIKRWQTYYRTVFPQSSQWLEFRGLVTAAVCNSKLPTSLLEYFLASSSSDQIGLVSCLLFLTNSRSPELLARIKRASESPQKMENGPEASFQL